MTTVLCEGDRGAEVGALHQALLERGLSVDALDLEAELFGSSTRAAVVALQLGAGLAPDGVVGTQTRVELTRPPAPGERFRAPGWRCDPSSVRAEARPAILAALEDLDRPTIEDPPRSNRGARVDRYGVPGLPWCAASCSSWVMRAEGHVLRRPLMSAFKWRDAARAGGWLLRPDAAPQPGDVGIVVRPNNHGHVELIVGVLDDGSLACIGGNVGNAVRGTIRPRDFWPLIARPIPLV